MFVLTTSTDLMNKTIGEMSTLFNMMPIVMLVIVVISISMAVLTAFSGTSSIIDRYPVGEDDEEPEDIKEVEKDARAILMKRYVNGEISDEEYTDKMSRL